jgi:hypothetical protein
MLISQQDNEALYYLIFKDEKPEERSDNKQREESESKQ